MKLIIIAIKRNLPPSDCGEHPTKNVNELAINPDNKYVKRKRPDPNNDSVAGPIL
jgi:hypothetical protein